LNRINRLNNNEISGSFYFTQLHEIFPNYFGGTKNKIGIKND